MNVTQYSFKAFDSSGAPTDEGASIPAPDILSPWLFSSDGDLVVAQDGRVAIWDFATGKRSHYLDGP